MVNALPPRELRLSKGGAIVLRDKYSIKTNLYIKVAALVCSGRV